MPVASHAQSACEPFSVVVPHDVQVRTYLDHAAEGQSIGDQHIATGPLHDVDGEVLGRFEAITVITHLDDSGTPHTNTDVSVHLHDGVIVYRVLSAPVTRDVSDTSGPHNSTEAARLIVAGSGVFAGATGDVELSRGGSHSSAVMNVSCP
jgi:hypothetical protein